MASGYDGLRTCVPTLIDWGELRGASIYARSDTKKQKLEDFQLTPDDALCKWSSFYSVLNMANSVLKYAPDVQQNDETYQEGAMKAHLCEAYFMRALCYFYLVRNFRDVPLVVEPYVDDSAPYMIAKSSEKEVIAQIKSDIETALETNAAPEFFDDEEWDGATKGRATKWALYALMADVSLWSEDYDNCIKYADLLINAPSTSPKRPVFMSSSDYKTFFGIYYPGNSNESIFELNFSGSLSQAKNSPSNSFTASGSASYLYTETMCDRLYEEAGELVAGSPVKSNRAYAAYMDNSSDEDTKTYSVWKYQGMNFSEEKNTSNIRPSYNIEGSSYQDGNFIVYRMADVLLMKAEALIWKGQEGFQGAVDLMNQVRVRSALNPLRIDVTVTSQLDMLKTVLNERDMELAAEGKRWYDLLRLGRSLNYKYKEDFVNIIRENNQTANPTWLASVLNQTDAWFLPISQSELDVNPLLVQNPYYSGTTN